MQALQNMNTEAITAQELQPALYDAFISYIDRCEKTTRTYLTNLRQFAAYLTLNGITRPTRDDVIAYRDYLSQDHKPNTVKQYLQSVRQFFNWTAAAGYYPNIAANVHTPKINQDTHKKDALTAADVLTIEKSITAQADAKRTAAAENIKDTAGRIDRATEQGKRLFAMYLLAVTAGLRTIELSRANVKDLELKNGSACLYVYGKGHTEADTKKPIALPVYNAIRDYLNSRQDRPTKDSPLFVATGNRSGGKRLATTTISTMLKHAMQQAGFNSDRLTAHSLRHTAGTNVMELTGNLYATQKYMRHASPATTEIYLHVDDDKQNADIAQELYNKYHGQDDNDRQQLESLLMAMTATQLQQLTGIAAAMATR